MRLIRCAFESVRLNSFELALSRSKGGKTLTKMKIQSKATSIRETEIDVEHPLTNNSKKEEIKRNSNELIENLTRKYQCNLCEKIFRASNGLRDHTKYFHTDFKPVQCDLCGKSFKRNYS